MTKMESDNNINVICENTKKAAYSLSIMTTEKKNNILSRLIEVLESNKANIQEKNKVDLEIAKYNGVAPAMIQRLEINDKVWKEMIDGINAVIKLPDPVGKILEERKLYNDIELQKVSVPLGSILIIYESRPNVTIDVATLCIKSGNSVILKGGKESINSNQALMKCLVEAIMNEGVNDSIAQYVSDRETATELMKRNDAIDVVIPRGGKGLVKTVIETATMPVLKHYEGICNMYVDKDVDNKDDFKKAIDIIENAKVQKPSACNSIENLLIHKDIAKEFLVKLKEMFDKNEVEIRGCNKTLSILNNLGFHNIILATDKDYATEYLAKIISIKIVNDLDEVLEFISKYGSKHSDAIITENKDTAETFLKNVDTSSVYHNASTRFTDGGKFGLGCEMGISTDKMHARGPVGLKELTSYKYILRGSGQVRE